MPVILQYLFAASFVCAILGVVTLREPIFNPMQGRWFRVGGLYHWRMWRVGGSFYIRRR